MKKIQSLIKLVLPGFLVAATGVGAGDLLTASLAGKHLGLVVLFVPVIGALFKYVLTFGIAKYQIATGKSLLSGWFKSFPRFFQYIFFFYLFIWTFMVSGAILNGAGASMAAIFNLPGDTKIYFGVAQTILSFALIKKGSFKLFETIMSILVAMMFFIFIFMALGMIDLNSQIESNVSLALLSDPWLIGVLGGVGGTLTILSYGYWIKESNREGEKGLNLTRIDLCVSYTLTAIFSMAMIFLGAKLTGFDGGKKEIISALSNMILFEYGSAGAFFFKIGFWAGIFSSLLGVWQSVPFIFSDALYLFRGEDKQNLEQTQTYKNYLLLITFLPIISFWIKFETIQKLYGVIGALFIPFCAFSLIYINQRLEVRYKNSLFETIILYVSLLFFISIPFIK